MLPDEKRYRPFELQLIEKERELRRRVDTLETLESFTPTPETTFYVDGTLGTDDSSRGFAEGADAFKTIQFAIDQIAGLVAGNVVINVAASTYTEDVVIQGKNFTGDFSITVRGTLSAQETVAGATISAGTGSTQGTVTSVGSFAGDSYNNLLCYFVTDDDYRLIDSHTDDVLTLVGVAPSSTAQDVIIYDWGTLLDGFLEITGGQQSVVLEDFDFGPISSNNLKVANYSSAVIDRVRIDSSSSGGILLQVFANASFFNTYSEPVTVANRTGGNIQSGSRVAFRQSKFFNSAGGGNGIIMQPGTVTFRHGSIMDGYATAMNIQAISFLTTGASAATGYPRFRNNTTALLATGGGIALNTSTNVYSGNVTDESPAGASDPAYID